MGSYNVAIDGNTSEHSRGDGDSAGFHIDAGNTNVLMQHNFFYDAEGYGIEVLGNNKNAIVRYNVIADSGWRQPNGGMVLTNNYNPLGDGAVSDGVVTNTNNTIEKNVFNNADPVLTTLDTAPVLADPAFQGVTPADRANPDTFKLSATSPARNAGVPVAGSEENPGLPDPTFDALGTGIFANFPPVPTKDFYGNTLPTNVRNIGADQD